MKSKQLLAILLVMALVLSMTACGAGSKEVARSLLEGSAGEETQEEPAEIPDEEPEPVEEIVEELSTMPETDGYYLISSIYSSENDTLLEDPEDLELSGVGGTYFRFNEDGTGIAYRDDDNIFPLTYDESTITIDGESQPYSIVGGQLVMEIPADATTLTYTFDYCLGEPPASEEASIVGWWEIVSGTRGDITYTKEDLAASGLSNAILVFYEDGTGYDQADGVPNKALTFDDSCIYYTEDGSTFSYTFDGTTLTVKNDTASLTFTRGVGEPPAPSVTADPVDSVDPMVDYWDGQWYGWWVIWSGTGTYAEFDGNWWDIAAEIECDKSNATIVLWDQDFPHSDPLGEVTLLIDPMFGDSEFGTAVSSGGYFYTDSVSSADWIFDPSDASYDNLLVFDGYGEDANGDTFDYSIYLRPWGLRWDDIEANAPEDLPEYYYDWYLPLIEAGLPIPDELPNGDIASSES